VGEGSARNRGYVIQAWADPAPKEGARFCGFDQGLACARARSPRDEVSNLRIGGAFWPCRADEVENRIEDFFAHGHGAHKALKSGQFTGF
jgi:hypothetical protein